VIHLLPLGAPTPCFASCETLQVAVGRAGFHGLPEDGVAEVTYSVAPEYRRRGYARAALSLLADRCVAAPDVDVVRAITRPDNTASRQLLSAAGFTQVPPPSNLDDGPWVVYDRLTTGAP
jgi:ribosomal-protein-alanine N-acetyltransferase